MINIEKAKNEFKKYISEYDLTDSNIDRKVYHSFRVMDYSEKIAKSLKLDKEQIELAILIGLLHDIARFEQYKTYHTFSDEKSNFDHASKGSEILERDNFIRKFIETSEYDNIIRTAIKNHNKFQIEDGLNYTTLMYSKIVRDADKLDILYEAVEMFWKSEQEIKEIENTTISDKYLNYIKNNKVILKDEKNQSKLDAVILIISFVFDINFKYSLKNILDNDYINKILNRFDYKNEETKQQIELIKKITYNYLKKNI